VFPFCFLPRVSFAHPLARRLHQLRLLRRQGRPHLVEHPDFCSSHPRHRPAASSSTSGGSGSGSTSGGSSSRGRRSAGSRCCACFQEVQSGCSSQRRLGVYRNKYEAGESEGVCSPVSLKGAAESGGVRGGRFRRTHDVEGNCCAKVFTDTSRRAGFEDPCACSSPSNAAPANRIALLFLAQHQHRLHVEEPANIYRCSLNHPPSHPNAQHHCRPQTLPFLSAAA
jgi:hypothetical protein